MSQHSLRQLLRRLSRDGWSYTVAGKSLCLTHQHGARVFCSRTPSDVNAVRNIEKDCQKALREHADRRSAQ